MGVQESLNLQKLKVLSLENELQRLKRLIESDGMTDDIALDVAKVRISLEYEQERLQELIIKADDEQKFKASKKYKDEKKRLDMMRDEIFDEIKDVILDVRALDKRISDLKILEKSFKRLARELDVSVSLANHGLGMVFRIGSRLKRFSEEYRTWVENFNF